MAISKGVSLGTAKILSQRSRASSRICGSSRETWAREKNFARAFRRVRWWSWFWVEKAASRELEIAEYEYG